MATKKRLFDDMTNLGLVAFQLAQQIDALFRAELSVTEFAESCNEIRALAGVNLPHPSQKSPLIPFMEKCFAEVNACLTQKKGFEVLVHFAKVLNGEVSEEYEILYPAIEVANLNTAPTWLIQALEVIEKLLLGTVDASLTGEKIAALIRNIPGDTTIGILTHACLRDLQHPNGHRQQIKDWLSLLKGEVPFHCEVKIQGLYSFFDWGNSGHI